MILDQVLALSVLFGTLLMCIWGRFCYDMVAAVLVISHALKNSGVVELIGRKLELLLLLIWPF